MENYQPLQEVAYIHLKQMIDRNELDPSKIYSETLMAKELNISRTPFKVALVRLSQDKYIDIIPSKGFRLHVFDKTDIVNLYQQRTAIEGYCAIMLMRKKDTPSGQLTIRQMMKTADVMQEMIKGNISCESFREQDGCFHKNLVGFVENKEFERLFAIPISYQIKTINVDNDVTMESVKAIYEEHMAILRAIIDSDFEGCYVGVQNHMKMSEQQSLEALEKKG